MSPAYDDGLSMRAHSPSAVSDGYDGPDYYNHESHLGAQDAANELEESLLGPHHRGRSARKRAPPGDHSDDSSDGDTPMAAKHIVKKRKLAKGPAPTAVDGHGPYQNMAAMTGTIPPPLAVKSLSGRGKGKGKQRETSVDSVATTTRGRKKPGPKKKYDALPPHTQESLGLGGGSASTSRDITPVGSRAASPTPTNMSATVYELDEVIPALKKARRIDDAGMWKRVKAVEEAQRKVWTAIARRDVVRVSTVVLRKCTCHLTDFQVYRYHTASFQARQAQIKRITTACALHARKPFQRTAKSSKDVQNKGKRLMREMLVFWKKNEREERDVRKREQKEATDRARVEEEKREAARQARKLEFLISQTELYSHFVGNKLKSTYGIIQHV